MNVLELHTYCTLMGITVEADLSIAVGTLTSSSAVRYFQPLAISRSKMGHRMVVVT